MTHWMISYKIINPSFMRKEKRNREKKLFWWKKQILATVAPRQITLERFNLRTTDIPMCPCFCPQFFLLSFRHFLPHFCSVRHSFNRRPSIFIMRIMISIYLLGRSHICKWFLFYSIILFLPFFSPLIFPFSCPFLDIYLIVWIRIDY